MTIAYRQSPEWLGLAEATRRTYSVYLRDIERLQNEPVERITRRILLGLRDAIAATRGAGASTGFLRTASALFGWAVERQWIEHSPAHRIRSLPGGHLPAWSADQADAAIAALPEPLRRVVVLALYTGQRRGDLIALPWTAYDGSTIKLRQQKTGARMTIPVHPNLKVELDAWRSAATSTMILTTAHGLPWKPQHVSHMLPIAMERIGLPPLNVHGLRKLAAARLADAGCSMHEIAAITGHRSLSMVQLYTASADQERLAGAAIIRLTQESTGGNRGKIKSMPVKSVD
jgi:integrase